MKLSVKATSPSTLGLKIDQLNILLNKDTALKLSAQLQQEANKIGRPKKNNRKNASKKT
ncbi:MAG: hypothetical protein JST75_08110 [Bacteroidetes bacterium]|nr:hypothetical protein [Bacteroidota bacterium]